MQIKSANLLGILNRHRARGIYIGKEVPPDKLDNALVNFPIGIRENVLALIDKTVFGSCKRGLAFTTEGLVWKNFWMTECGALHMAWDEQNFLQRF